MKAFVRSEYCLSPDIELVDIPTPPLAEAGKALDYLADGHAQGKVIICP